MGGHCAEGKSRRAELAHQDRLDAFTAALCLNLRAPALSHFLQPALLSPRSVSLHVCRPDCVAGMMIAAPVYSEVDEHDKHTILMNTIRTGCCLK